jgi:hypothetical protein
VFVIAENLSCHKHHQQDGTQEYPGHRIDARLVSEDKRLVNGAEVLAVQIEGHWRAPSPLLYLGYYHR